MEKEKKTLEKAAIDEFQDWETPGEELHINWKGFLADILRNSKAIAAVTVLFAALGVGVALIQKKQYTVTVVVTPEFQTTSSTARVSSLSSLSSMLGLNMSNATSNDALNIRLFPEIATSIPFLTQLFNVEVYSDYSEEEMQTGTAKQKKQLFYDYITTPPSGLGKWMASLLDDGKEQVEPDTVLQARLSPKQRNAVKTLRKAIEVSVDSKTYMTSISITLDDPWIATQMADTISNRLQQFILAYRTKKGQDDLDYYTKMSAETYEKYVKAQDAYARSVDFDRNVMFQSINNKRERLQSEISLTQQLYTQMEMQREQALARIQEAKPVFAVLQPATYPEKPSSMSRKLIVLAFMFLGFVLSSGWYAGGRRLWAKMRSMKLEKK